MREMEEMLQFLVCRQNQDLSLGHALAGKFIEIKDKLLPFFTGLSLPT